MKFEVYTEKRDYGFGKRLAVFSRHPDGSLVVVEPLVLKKCEPHAVTDTFTIDEGPMMRGTVDAILQAFLDHAWERGMRPAGFADTTEQVKSLKEHLQDMRALVFKGESKFSVKPKESV